MNLPNILASEASKFLKELHIENLTPRIRDLLTQGPTYSSHHVLNITGSTELPLDSLFEMNPNLTYLKLERVQIRSTDPRHNKLEKLSLDIRRHSMNFLEPSRFPKLETLNLTLLPQLGDNELYHLHQQLNPKRIFPFKNLEIDNQHERSEAELLRVIIASSLFDSLETLTLNFPVLNKKGKKYSLKNQDALQNLKKLNLAYRQNDTSIEVLLQEAFGERINLMGYY